MISIRDGWFKALAHPSEALKHYYNIAIAVVFFFVAQLLICASHQPFWSCGLEIPGQIVAMVFLWITVWVVQKVFFEPGQGVDKFYHRFLRAPVSGNSSAQIVPVSLRKDILIFVLDRRRFSTSTCPLASQCHS